MCWLYPPLPGKGYITKVSNLPGQGEGKPPKAAGHAYSREILEE
jgi:hypothetical protein